MESEVNVHWPELASNRSDKLQIISLQLYRLAMCFDIYTEAISCLCTTDQMFHKEKIFFRPARYLIYLLYNQPRKLAEIKNLVQEIVLELLKSLQNPFGAFYN